MFRGQPLHPLRTLLVFGALCAGLALVMECLSSFALYRYFAFEQKELLPTGVATVDLIDHALIFASGKHKHIVVSANRFPLFLPDATLGFVMRPGSYRIDETAADLHHQFNLRVTDGGHRATAESPVNSANRVFVTGDSAIFGWGLNDEDTLPWLLQSHLAKDAVINLSLTSYSTVQALLQLKQVAPALNANDTVILFYHPFTNELNAADASRLKDIATGYEVQMGGEPLRTIKIPYGTLGANDRLAIEHIAPACVDHPKTDGCALPVADDSEAMRITELTMDEIIALKPGRLVVGFISGPDDDPVIAHLRKAGVAVADLRSNELTPDATDRLLIDKHPGPFWQRQIYTQLLTTLCAGGAGGRGCGPG